MDGLQNLVRGAYRLLRREPHEWRLVHSTDKSQIFIDGCVSRGPEAREIHTFIKVESFLDARADNVFLLCSDRSIVTQSRWDDAVDPSTGTVERYDVDDGNMYRVRKYGLEGILWTRPSQRILIFVHETAMLGIWINPLEDNADRCFMTTIAKGFKKSLHKWAEENLLYERSAPNALNIYSPWKCSICLKNVPPHELECRMCRKERYWRCQDMQCYEAQMERAEKCWRCGK